MTEQELIATTRCVLSQWELYMAKDTVEAGQIDSGSWWIGYFARSASAEAKH